MNALRKRVADYGQSDWFLLSNEKVVIKPRPEKEWHIVLYMIMFVALPAGAAAWFLMDDDSNPNIFWLLVLSVYFGYMAINTSQGYKILTIDFLKKQFVFEPGYKVVRRIMGTRQLDFANVSRLDLSSRSAGRGTNWLRLSFYDKENLQFAFIDFSNEYPESTIADGVKTLIEVIVAKNKNEEVTLLQ